MAVKQIKHWLDSTSISDVFFWFLRQLRWVGVLAIGTISWVDLKNIDPLTLPNLFENAKSDPTWLVVAIIATGFMAWDPGQRYRSNRHRRQKEEDRCDHALLALNDFKELVRPAKQKVTHRDLKCVQPLLLAIQYDLEVCLGYSDADRIKVNLLLLNDTSTGDCADVVCRSSPSRRIPIGHSLGKDTPAKVAIDKNMPHSVPDIRRQLPNYNCKYKSVVAVPIEHKSKIYGIITVDSPTKGRFCKDVWRIDCIIRPYCAQIFLLLPAKQKSLDCPMRLAR